MRSLLTALAILLLSSGSSQAGTIVMTGDRGIAPLTIQNNNQTNQYVADDTFRVTTDDVKGHQNGIELQNAGTGSSWTGGLIDTIIPDDAEYLLLKSMASGGFRVAGGNGFVLRDIKIEHNSDNISFQSSGSTGTWIVDHVWSRKCHDDCIENDNRPPLTILRNSYFDITHTILSVRRAAAKQIGTPPPHRFECHDSFIRMGDLKDSRDKRAHYPWDNDDWGFGQLLKTELDGAQDTILFENCMILLPQLPKQTQGNHAFPAPNTKIDPASRGNVLVWTGSQESGGNGGIPMVEINGVKVPASLKLNQWPAGSMRVTDDPTEFNRLTAAWVADFNHENPPPPPPPPSDIAAPLDLMDRTVVQLQTATKTLETELPDGNLERALRNSGANSAQNFTDVLNALVAAQGSKPEFVKMRGYTETLRQRSVEITQLLTQVPPDGEGAYDAINPALTVDITAQAPVVRAAAEGTEPPPPPPPEDCADVVAELEARVTELEVQMDALTSENDDLAAEVANMREAIETMIQTGQGALEP